MYTSYTGQNISNISHYIRYTTQTYRDDNKVTGYGICINTFWDTSNKEIDYLLYKEFNFTLENTSKRFNLMWLEKAKEVFEWKKGNEMKLFTKMNREGFFDIFEGNDKIGKVRPEEVHHDEHYIGFGISS